MNAIALRKLNAARYAKHMATRGVDVEALVTYKAKRPLPNQRKARVWSKSRQSSSLTRGQAAYFLGYAGN